MNDVVQYVVPAVLISVPATLAALSSWRTHHQLRTANGHTAGQQIDTLTERVDGIDARVGLIWAELVKVSVAAKYAQAEQSAQLHVLRSMIGSGDDGTDDGEPVEFR